MKSGSAAALLLILLPATLAQLTWHNLMPLPLARSDAGSAVFGNLIYLLGGCDADQNCYPDTPGVSPPNGYCQCPSSTAVVIVYDTLTGTYSTAPSMPIPRYRHDVCVVGRRLFVFGGRTMPDATGWDHIITQVDMYDSVLGGWTANVSTYPSDLGSDNSCATLNGVIYLAGGYSETYDTSFNTTYRFDPVSYTFTRMNGRMLQGRGDFSSVAGAGNILRAWGGYTNASSDLQSTWACKAIATSEVYDPVADVWSAGPSLPFGLAEKDDGIDINGTIYSIGGERKARPSLCEYYDLTAVSNVFALNSSAISWTTVTSLPAPRMRSTSASVNSTIYVFGGQSAFVNDSTLQFFPIAYTAYALTVSGPTPSPTPTPAPYTWATLEPLPFARSDSGSAVFDNRIFLLGGCDADQICYPDTPGVSPPNGYCQCPSSTAVVIVYDTLTGTYSTAPSMPIPRYRHDVCVVGRRLFVFGGRTMPDATGWDHIITQVDMYDSVLGGWTANVSTYPSDLGSDNSCATLNGVIYLAGGYSETYDTSFDTTYRFDPVSYKFTRMNGRMLQGRGDFSSVAAGCGNVIRAWGGYTNASSDLQSTWACNAIATSEVYDPVADMWYAGPSLPFGLGEKDDGIDINGTIISIGGERKARPALCEYYDLTAVSNVFALNASAGATWTTMASMPAPRMRSTSASVNNTVYVFGGQSVFVNDSTLQFFPIAYDAFSLTLNLTAPEAAPCVSISPSVSPSLSTTASVSSSVSVSPSVSPTSGLSVTPTSSTTPSTSQSPTTSKPATVSASASASTSASASRSAASTGTASTSVTATTVPAAAAVLSLPVFYSAPVGVTSASVCTSAVNAAVSADVSTGVGAGAASVYVTACTVVAAGGRAARRALLLSDAAAFPRAAQAGTTIQYTVAAVAPSGGAQNLYNALYALSSTSFTSSLSAVQSAAGVAGTYAAAPQSSAIAAACGGGGTSTCGTLPTGPTSPAAASGPNVGAIVGGVIGGVAAVAIIVGIVLYLRHRAAPENKAYVTEKLDGKDFGRRDVERSSSLRNDSSVKMDDEPVRVNARAAGVGVSYGSTD